MPFGGASIVTTTFYDANSRVKRLVDDRGDVTDYEYDTLDRETVMRFHDGSTRVRVYNEASDVIRFTNENGSVMENTFDALGRKTQCDITKAVGVVGTDQQSFEYDGLSRQTQAIDAVGSTDATVQMSYDSLNRVIEDSQTYTGSTRNVTTTAFVSHPLSQLQFPNGRKIDNTYDLLYRRTDVADNGGSTIATWQFFGPSRVAELTMGNGLICSHLNNARTRSSIQEGQTELGWQGQVTPVWGDQSSDRLGYDGASRMITKRYLAGGINPITFGYLNTSSVVGFTTSFDRSSNKFFERHLHAESRSHLYEPFANGTPQGGYDSIDRLRQYQRGVLSTNSGHNNLGGGGIDTPISLPNTDQSRNYDLDGLGNWRRTVYEPVGGSQTTEVRQHNALNQITRRDSTPFSYDLNGNLLDDGLRLYTWDALNRLANVRRKPDGLVIGEYTYDATARRIQKIVTNGGLSGNIPNGTTHYLYTGWQCLEECDGFGSPLKQYVWGIYIDELLQQRLLTTINNHGAGDYYPLSDLLYRTTALTDSAANIIESYDTDAYGNTLIFTAPGTANNWWADDAVRSDNPTCEWIFTTQRYNAELRMYLYRARYYCPALSRFITRDPIVYRDDQNIYSYVKCNPVIHADPFGLGDPLPKQCKVPPDTCIVLLMKMARFAADYAKRLSEWKIDKLDIRGLRNPSNYNPRLIQTHYDLLTYTSTQAKACYTLAVVECGKCTPTAIKEPRIYPLPVYPTPPIVQPNPRDVPQPIPMPRPSPEPIWGLVAFGAVIIVATIVEDVATLGAGVLDDPATIGIGGALVVRGLGYGKDLVPALQ